MVAPGNPDLWESVGSACKEAVGRPHRGATEGRCPYSAGLIGRCRFRVTGYCYILDLGFNNMSCAPLFVTADSLMGSSRRHGGRKHRVPTGMINMKPTSQGKCKNDLKKKEIFPQTNDEI